METTRAAGLFDRVDRRLWESTGHNPVRLLQDVPREQLDQVAGQHGMSISSPRSPRPSAATWSGPRSSPSEGHLPRTRDRLLLAEFALTRACRSIPAASASSPATTSSPRRPRPAARRRGPALPPGLLPAVDAGGLAARGVPDSTSRPDRSAVCEGRRHALAVSVADRRPRRVAPDLALDVGRVAALPARHRTSRRTARAIAQITARLYGGDRTRIHQEIVLGIGGIRALARSASSPPSAT